MKETYQQKTIRRMHILMSHIITGEEDINFCSLIADGGERWLKYLPALNIPEDWQDTTEFVQILTNIAGHFQSFLIEQKKAGKIGDYKFVGHPAYTPHDFGVKIFKRLNPCAVSYKEKRQTFYSQQRNHSPALFNRPQRILAPNDSFFQAILKLMSCNLGRHLNLVNDVLLKNIPIDWDKLLTPYPGDWDDAMLPGLVARIKSDMTSYLKSSQNRGEITDYKFNGDPFIDPFSCNLQVDFDNSFTIKPKI